MQKTLLKNAFVAILAVCTAAAFCQPTTTQLTTVPATQPTTVRHIVPASCSRPLLPATDATRAAYLRQFDVPAKDFCATMRRKSPTATANVYGVTFPSPLTSRDPRNNTVHAEYHRACSPKSHRPAVILLHPLNVQPDAMRTICKSLTANGIDCLWLMMPYYGERSDNNVAAALAMAVSTPRLIEATRQAVMDVRRATAFLASRPDIDPTQISLMGCSLGSLVATLTLGVDGRYPQGVLILSGGDITQMLADNPIVMPMLSLTIRAERTATSPTSKDIDVKDLLRQRLQIIEPLTWCDRAADTRILMINARQDTLIPPTLTAKLAEALPHTESRWYDCDHWGLPVDRATADVIAFLKR